MGRYVCDSPILAIMTIRDFQALTFDCYGTLIDWETGLLNSLRPWAARHGVRVSDERLLEIFAEAEAHLEGELPRVRYSDILRSVHARIAQALNVPVTTAEAEAFAQSVGDWPPFPDTVAALQDLKQRHRLVIISNVDRAAFARTNAILGVAFDAIVTAEDVGAYKPDPRMFERALSVLADMGIRRDRTLHVAQSLYHDHVPAKALGLATVWVDRRHDRPGWGATAPPGAPIKPDLVVNSLAELAAHP
ncbi:MAG: haloacid dehalogenase type II [Candidatus Zixiibacteriota bacterium]